MLGLFTSFKNARLATTSLGKGSTVFGYIVQLLDTIGRHIKTYPTPENISYLWSFGMLAGMCLVIQLLTGIVAAMHYAANTMIAFASVEHIMRDVVGGWLIRYAHANGASFFFIVVYLHMARGLFYRSYIKNASAWVSGVIIFFLLMAVAFIGYVLPWGQMSFWGATVITNLCSAVPFIGEGLVYWIWGGFSVANATLNRFFSLHFLVPFIVTAIVLVHLFLLHNTGSSNPVSNWSEEQLDFSPYFVLKDLLAFFVFAIFFIRFVAFYPNDLGHPDNFIEANPLVTPAHIVPEWYFLPFYAILRSIPDKLGGVIAMVAAILVLALLPLLNFGRIGSSHKVSVTHKISFWVFACIFVILGWLGGKAVEDPYLILGQFCTWAYFVWFFVTSTLVEGESEFESTSESNDSPKAPSMELDGASVVFSSKTDFKKLDIRSSGFETTLA